MKNLIIRLFNLTELRDVIERALRRQRQEDQRVFDRIREDMEHKHQQEKHLITHKYESLLRMARDDIKVWERKEKMLNDREYKAKVQIGINYNIAYSIQQKMRNASETFMDEIGELQGVFDEAKEYHEQAIKKVGV